MQETVSMAHGSGGTMMRELINNIFLQSYATMPLLKGDDAAALHLPTADDARMMAMTTDSFVVSPHFFPGGDIGKLAICGTVNDLATSGASPHYISCAFILEEGYPLQDLKRICMSMARASEEAGVLIVTGDTKVVERGHGDGVYINTTGVGFIAPGLDLSGANCRAGDKILLSGTLGDHGIAIISVREGLGFSTSIQSDAAPLNHLVQSVIAAVPEVRCFRDPTRGGLASTLNELAVQSHVDILVYEDAVPVADEVRGACDLLGYDVFQVANEGKMVCVVPGDVANIALSAMKSTAYGANAAIIGEVLPCGSQSVGFSASEAVNSGAGNMGFGVGGAINSG
ncbi:MAG: hydrogenase expression/formation protein HypE, partial [Coriobacteriales bacterium]|nr:hydrogenase expression/formation protein HypE [Coriobacteriales bacterium]